MIAMSTPIFEPELSYLPFACSCGVRMLTQIDLELHKHETCIRRDTSRFSNLEERYGIADGGRRT